MKLRKTCVRISQVPKQLGCATNTYPKLRGTNVKKTLRELTGHEQFASRHIAINKDARNKMLSTIQCQSVEELISKTVPASIRHDKDLNLGDPMLEQDVIAELRKIAAKNQVRTSLIGMGYYNTITPPVILRNVFENPAWYTAYTPYQPEISQGRLEALLNFQTMISELTALPIANASLLDEATACAEAMSMALRISKSESTVFAVHADTHPQIIAVLRTRALPIGVTVITATLNELSHTDCFGALISLPSSSGFIPTSSFLTSVCNDLHARNSIAIATTDLLACTLLLPPGRLGFDIAVGSAQRFGVPMGAGGPHAAFIATNEQHARALPGRIVGVSTDTQGRPALRLALQTREQHIRREKATSNICTAQALLANIASFYAVWHGRDGLVRIAERVHRLASIAAAGLKSQNFELKNETWFDTVAIEVTSAEQLCQRALVENILLRKIDETSVSFSLDETSTQTTVEALWRVFGVTASVELLDMSCDLGICESSRRTDEFLTQTTFNRYHSEHEMLRYLRRLSDKDLALDRTMIPLGSCTMKLNATTEMLPITWAEFAEIHPYAPSSDMAGYAQLIDELSSMLLEITGYDGISLQPNAGSQGELAGLLAIRAYHQSRNESQRVVCLIPSSAHGTNAASAVMAGMSVVVVACDDSGNVDIADLQTKCMSAGNKLAALMITYPSTHGVFEEQVVNICELIHAHGGQVYVDGANLNALVGLARPGSFGADVSHLNLHKTFCIPHGGGGPGVGPVAVKQHLTKFLPSHPTAIVHEYSVGAVAGAPYGSALILPISWVYIKLMGSIAMRDATVNAILSANYIAKLLDEYFPVVYRGINGFVAHECIIDIRQTTKATGVTNDDIAKRLMDFGFHAPTMSFPVAGTLMIEPTESETIDEIDRFCNAMIAISGEIEEIAGGKIQYLDSPLHNAPHTVEDLCGDWTRKYSQSAAAFATPALRTRSYFVPVSRIDSAHGDRNLICSCEPLENYATSLQ